MRSYNLKRGKLLERTKLDKIDMKILRTLQRDARTPFRNIAKQCNTSTDTIIRRFNKMKKMGIISGTMILLNPKKLGYEHIASFSINANYARINEVIKFIQEIPETLHCVQSIGRYNVFSIALFKDFTRLNEVRDLIRKHSDINNVSTNIWVGEVLLCPENFEFKEGT